MRREPLLVSTTKPAGLPTAAQRLRGTELHKSRLVRLGMGTGCGEPQVMREAAERRISVPSGCRQRGLPGSGGDSAGAPRGPLLAGGSRTARPGTAPAGGGKRGRGARRAVPPPAPALLAGAGRGAEVPPARIGRRGGGGGGGCFAPPQVPRSALPSRAQPPRAAEPSRATPRHATPLPRD